MATFRDPDLAHGATLVALGILTVLALVWPVGLWVGMAVSALAGGGLCWHRRFRPSVLEAGLWVVLWPVLVGVLAVLWKRRTAAGRPVRFPWFSRTSR